MLVINYYLCSCLLRISRINHSCDPNCVLVFNGSTAVLRSVKALAAGDEVGQDGFVLEITLKFRAYLKKKYMPSALCLWCFLGIPRSLQEDRMPKHIGT